MTLPRGVFEAVEFYMKQGMTRDEAIHEIEEKLRLPIQQEIKERIPT